MTTAASAATTIALPLPGGRTRTAPQATRGQVFRPEMQKNWLQNHEGHGSGATMTKPVKNTKTGNDRIPLATVHVH